MGFWRRRECFLFLAESTENAEGVYAEIVGTFRKTQLLKTKFEPITFSITILTLLIMGTFSLVPGHTNGEKWIVGENKETNQLISKQKLTLRKNGNFTIDLIEADFGCSISGSYVKNGDTIILDQTAIDRTNSTITSVYLMESNELIPLVNTGNKITFNITKRE